MAAMNEFLRRLDDAGDARRCTGDLDATWNERARARSTGGCAEREPAGAGRRTCRRSGRSATRSPSRYNWMLQYYLRAEGLALSWVGTGRLIFSLNYTRRGLRGGRRALRRRRRGDAAATAGGGRRAADQQVDQAPHPARDARQRSAQRQAARLHSRAARCVLPGRVDQLAAQQVQRRPVVQLDVVERVGEDLREPDQPVCTSRMKNRCMVRNSRPPTPSAEPDSPGDAVAAESVAAARTARTASDRGRARSGDERPDRQAARPCAAGCSRPSPPPCTRAWPG